MGLLDHYRQWAGMSDEEVGGEMRRRSSDRRERALARVDPLDLSGLEWPEFPHPDVVAAVTFAARGALNRAPDPEARELRAELARRHGVEVERIVVGHGASQLLEGAARALLGPGDELVCPWPSYRLFPRMARDAGARAVPVEGTLSPERLLAAVTQNTRIVAVASPNDPTGEVLGADGLRELTAGLPERAWIVLDEALVDFAVHGREDALDLLDELPRLLVVRTLSKAYGLAGLRCGWALGPPGAAELLSRLAPAGGLATPVQAGALEALLEMGGIVATRREAVAAERGRILVALASSPYTARPSESNALWLRHAGVRGDELADRLGRDRIIVARGHAWGDADHVRVQVQTPGATQRLLRALDIAA